MHASLKTIGARVRIGNWSPMVWATLVLVLACVAGTAIVGVKLYAITAQPAQFSTR